MRITFQRTVIAAFLTLVMGASAGSIKDEFTARALLANKLAAEHAAQEDYCFTEALYYEGRGAARGVQIMEGMVILARVTDPDPQWPKTICGVVHQQLGGKSLFSYWKDEAVMSRPIDAAAWQRAKDVADYLKAKAWVYQKLPHGAACVRSYKVLNEKLATLPVKALKQLHVSAHSLGFFARTQKLVFKVADTGFYENKEGCDHPLPAM